MTNPAPAVTLADVCRLCGADDLWSSHFNAAGDGCSAETRGARYRTLCQSCGTFQDVKLTAVQREVLTALAAGRHVPVHGQRQQGDALRCTPSTAVALANLGLVEATERTRWRDGRERSYVSRIRITPAGEAAVAR